MSSVMKLLIVTRETAADRHYGLGRTLQPVLDHLVTKGHFVEYYDQSATALVHQKWQPRFQSYLGFIFGSLTPAIAERLIQGMSAANRAISEGFTHVWVHDPWLAAGIHLGVLRKKRMARPFKLIISEHGLGSYAWAVSKDGLKIGAKTFRRFMALERYLLKRADAVFAPSYVARDALLRDLGLTATPDNFHVMGYGRPTVQPCSRIAAHRYFGLPLEQAAPVILAAGRIAPVKGFSLLIEAAGHLQHHHNIAAQVIVAGGGDGSELIALAEKLKLSHRPIIGFQDDINWSLGAADLYVSTCPVESFGQANREALAAGLPAIVPASGGSGEVLGLGACLIPISDPDPVRDADERVRVVQRLAAKMAEILGSNAHHQYWREKSLQQAGEWPEWSDLADLYEQRLSRL